MQHALRSRSLFASSLLLPVLLGRSVPRGDGDDPAAVLKGLLAKNNNDMGAVAMLLYGENHTLREGKRTLEADLGKAQKAVLPEGHVAVSTEDAALLAKYKPLGTPDELKTAKGERDTLQGDKTRLESEVTTLKDNQAKAAHATLLGEIADDVEPGVKWSKPVLARLDQLTPGLSFERRSVTEDGKTFNRTFIKYKDGEGETAPLKEMSAVQFAAQNPSWKDFLPALQVQAQGAGDDSQGGTRHIAQGSGGSNAAGDVFSRIRKQQEDAAKAQSTSGKSLEERLHMRVASAPGAAV